MDRVKGRRYRPITSLRDIIGDNWSMYPPPGPQGVYGYKSKFHISVKQYGPQKGKKRAAKRKNPCKLISKRDDLKVEGKLLERLKELREKMYTLICLEDYTGRNILGNRLLKIWGKINQEIHAQQTPQENQMMELHDIEKKKSLFGLFKARGVGATNHHKLIKQIMFLAERL